MPLVNTKCREFLLVCASTSSLSASHSLLLLTITPTSSYRLLEPLIFHRVCRAALMDIGREADRRLSFVLSRGLCARVMLKTDCTNWPHMVNFHILAKEMNDASFSFALSRSPFYLLTAKKTTSRQTRSSYKSPSLRCSKTARKVQREVKRESSVSVYRKGGKA